MGAFRVDVFVSPLVRCLSAIYFDPLKVSRKTYWGGHSTRPRYNLLKMGDVEVEGAVQHGSI